MSLVSDPTFSLFFGVAVGLSALATTAAGTVWRRRRFERRSRERRNDLHAAGFAPPPTLHPLIDPARCIGCGACARSCPHGDGVFGLIAGRAAVLDTSECVGHGVCASECPTQAIRLVFGTAEQGVDIPALDGRYETNVPGLYIAGELGGRGLLEIAVRQAGEVIRNISAALAAERPGSGDAGDVVDVAIVGAGPAGLTAALAAIELGLTYSLLEQAAEPGGALRQYPQHKIVTTAPLALPLLGPALASGMTKEELVEVWRTATEAHGVHVECGVEVERVAREADGSFVVTTSRGRRRARTVVLCAGRRGTPRTLGVPGETAGRVAYELVAPAVYAGKRVLVVGGGDSAVEAALRLAGEPGTAVTLCHRGAAFSRARRENRARLDAAEDAGCLQVLLACRVLEILPGAVRLAAGGDDVEIANDHVLVFAGGDAPHRLLASAGVELRRHHAEASGAGAAAPSRLAPAAAAAGAALAGAMLWLGRAYYFRPAGAEVPDGARAFGSSGVWGHAMGFVAAGLLLVNLAYLARKELPCLQRAGSLRTWLRVHVVSGLFAGGFALFHSTLAARNLFSAWLYLCLGAVVATGLIGRFLYALVPHDTLRKRLVAGWRLAHGVLAVILLALVITHVAIDVWVGYRWIF